MDIIWKEQGFIYKGEYRELDEHTLLLDGSLSREEAAWHPHAYCDIREAFAGRELSEGSPKNPTVMYIAPNVYWIDDPLATDTMQEAGAIHLRSMSQILVFRSSIIHYS